MVWGQGTALNRRPKIENRDSSCNIKKSKDEATSGLDDQLEKLAQVAVERVMVGRTSVVVAHRLSSIQNCDTVV
uniref:ABC transmembrane type-1 domain-containing protein n=1 Tax=Solanum lycopersicum TaxID=4081 RepID=A0A3Q7J9M2_SOLLC